MRDWHCSKDCGCYNSGDKTCNYWHDFPKVPVKNLETCAAEMFLEKVGDRDSFYPGEKISRR